VRLSPHPAQHLRSFSIQSMEPLFPFQRPSQTFICASSHFTNLPSPYRKGTACAFAGYFVRHVPLYSVLPQARGLRLQSSSWCAWLSHAPTPMPHPTPQEGIGISYGSRLPTSTCLGILPEVSRVHTVGLKRDDGGGVLLDAPSAFCGSRDCLQGRTRWICNVPITLATCAMSNPTSSIYD
jgi:hypothetical protein